MNHEELLQAEISVIEFMSLFQKEDHYSNKILAVVNEEIRVARKRNDEVARKIIQSHIL
jgi:hypothetical protein